MGMVSREPILPVGFGITDKNNKFIGVLSIGLNTYKLTSLLQSSLEDKLSSFALIGKGNEILLNSQNFGDDSLKDIEKYLAKYEGKLKNGFFKVNGQTYYLEDSAEYPFHILAGTDENLTRKEFWSSFFPKITNTVYITIFFLILLYFFRQKLLKPVVKLANATNQISNNKLDALVPTSEIYEVSLLSDSILTLKRFLQKEEGLKRQLKIDKEKAQQENISKNDFLSATAHDLKNLIAGIMGMAELIRFNLNTKPKTNEIKFTREEFEENMEHLNDIDKCSNELLDFIHDLLDINQASTGDFKIIEEEEVDLTNLTRRSIAMLSTRANKSQQSLVYNISKNSKSLIAHNLDSRRVKQILVNLISNAIKYSKKNTKIEISIATLDTEKSEEVNKKIVENIESNNEFSTKHKNHLLHLVSKKRNEKINRIEIIVKDHGFGMDEDEIKIALTKYGMIKNQGACQTTGMIDSTGLGLPIVKHLVEMQGGLLEIKSKKGFGTEVRVIF
jgi:two-component system sensor histidine kinase ChiS